MRKSIKVDLIDSKGEVQYGLNWGQRVGRNPDQAYIQLPSDVYKSDFFPSKGKYFVVRTDDGQTIIMTRAQKTDDGTAIQTPDDNSILGKYIRKRLGLQEGVPITASDIAAYGRNNVVITKIDNLNYEMNFSNGVNEHKSVVEDKPLQLIYYGAPGTGKSFSIDAATNEDNSVRTTFHPDSDYASFVGAYKPTMENVPITVSGVSPDGGGYAMYVKGNEKHSGTERKIVYKYVPQAFMKAYVEAWKRYSPDEDVPYYLVIEEINRGNCAQIFGDLFQLLDRNNQGCSSYAISADEDIAQFLRDDENGFAMLAEDQRQVISNFILKKDSGKEEHIGHSIINGSKLLLPPNFRIWATMNTSDQSLFPIDSAFKRRWNWKYMPIDYHPINNSTGKPIDWKFQIGDALYSWGEFLGKINPEIYTLTESSDKQMGYFFAKADPSTDVISEEVFLNKVLFYLWTDVFKDYDVSSEIFRNDKKNRSFIFTDFFDKEQPTALTDFIGNLKLTPIDGDDELSNDGKHSRLSVTLPDGSVLNTGNMTDIYVNALKSIGLDRVAETLGVMKKGKYPLITKELIPIENPASKRRYRKEGDYYILVGPDTYPYADTLNDVSKRLSISMHADFE